MKALHLTRRWIAGFTRNERGAVLAEALIVMPFVTLFSVGILEFGNMLWQKEQIETGLRDAARYLARCQSNTSFVEACTRTIATNIAFYGTASPVSGTPLRVSGWGPSTAVITIIPPAGTAGDVITVSTSHAYDSSNMFAVLGIGAITIEAFHEQRYIGW